MKQLLEKLPFFKKKKKGLFDPQIKKLKKTVKGLKIKLFLLYTLPICILTLAKAVFQEYGKIKTRQAAINTDNKLN
ncbi:MAG: hypothetical protein IKU20_04980 [Lachnospiraceae bacterium]|nr:hypothetical protein [Lachnospiraceae bacterium]